MTEYTIGKFAGFIVGVIVGLIIIAIIIRKLNHKNSNGKYRTEYDERQQVIRGRGYAVGFYAMAVYLFILMMVDMLGASIPATMQILAFAGIIVGIVADCCYCVWKGAYWGMNNNKKAYAIFFVVAGIINFGAFYMACREGRVFENGMLSTTVINLLCGIMLVAIGLASLLKSVVDKRITSDEEDE